MKNKTEELKQVHRLIDELEALSGFNDVTINKFAELRVLVNGITPTNTEQIKKEAVWSFASYLAIKGVVSAKMLDYYDDFIKQYLEKGQND